ncbi:transposase [Streptomyces sp. NPDC005374]|uniref:transposase n=1 Tax=Streptomyces sp. NPDC005374 TaxID=3364713 RepID=UPI00368F6126
MRVLGVDDFALRKGDSYATIRVDLADRQPVNVLPGRDAEPRADWLRDHTEIEVICRDRAGTYAYAGGARSGTPQARQAADAWHLLHSLTETLSKTTAPITRASARRSRRPHPPRSPPRHSAGRRSHRQDVLAPAATGGARTTWRHTAVQQLLVAVRGGNPWPQSAVSCGWITRPSGASPALKDPTNC